MRYKTGLQISRRTDAQRLTNKLLQLLDTQTFTKYGIGQEDYAAKNAFMVGYINSVLAQVAGASPASLKELESSVKYMERG
jgi:hypothetical protein